MGHDFDNKKLQDFFLSDDGARLLWLEFRGPGGEEELDMGKNPKVIDLRIFNDNFYDNVTL